MIADTYYQPSVVSLARMHASGESLDRISQNQNKDVESFLRSIHNVFMEMIFEESKAADQLKHLDQILSVVDTRKPKQYFEDLVVGFENYYKNKFLPYVRMCLVQYDVQLPLKKQDVDNITNEDLKHENRPIFVGADSRQNVPFSQRSRENKQYLICLDTQDNIFKNLIKFNQNLENYYTRIWNHYKRIGNRRRDKCRLKFTDLEKQCENILKKPFLEVQIARKEIEKRMSCIRMQEYNNKREERRINSQIKREREIEEALRELIDLKNRLYV